MVPQLQTSNESFYRSFEDGLLLGSKSHTNLTEYITDAQGNMYIEDQAAFKNFQGDIKYFAIYDNLGFMDPDTLETIYNNYKKVSNCYWLGTAQYNQEAKVCVCKPNWNLPLCKTYTCPSGQCQYPVGFDDQSCPNGVCPI